MPNIQQTGAMAPSGALENKRVKIKLKKTEIWT